MTVELLIEHDLQVRSGDWLVEVLEVDVVVDDDAALTEGLDLETVERVTDQRVSVNFRQLSRKMFGF